MILTSISDAAAPDYFDLIAKSILFITLCAGITFGLIARKNGALMAKILGTVGFTLNCTILIIPIIITIFDKKI